MPARLSFRFALPLAAAFLLASCGADQSPQAARVAVKVNGKPVPMSRVQAALERGAAERGRDADRGREAKALERAIDQELLVQAATRAKLERDPQVAQALDGARRQILAQAYIDRAVSGAGDSNPDEQREFYAGNPALFSERRIYRFQEVAVEGPSEKLGALKDQVAGARGMEDLAAWLRARNLAFNMTTATKPAEQVPLNFLPRLAAMKDGELAVFPTPGGASILQLLQSQQAALTEQQAEPLIERFLLGRRRLQMAEEAVGRLRAKAKIVYQGEFRPGRQETSQRGFVSRAGTDLIGTAGGRFGDDPGVLR
jgi:EpsD family peptidyl-prolyl cis-trans isomerase